MKEEIEKWNREGDIIIMMGDFNDYILSPKPRLFFLKIGLREIITDKHRIELPGNMRSIKKKSIGGIWASPGLFTASYGYLPVNRGLKSYHRLIWFKQTFSKYLSDNTLPSRTPISTQTPPKPSRCPTKVYIKS